MCECLSLHGCVGVSLSLCESLSVCLWVCMCMCVSVWVCFCVSPLVYGWLSDCVGLCGTVWVSVSVCVCLCMCVCLSVTVSMCVSVSVCTLHYQGWSLGLPPWSSAYEDFFGVTFQSPPFFTPGHISCQSLHQPSSDWEAYPAKKRFI